MSDRRAIVSAEKAIYALADKEELVCFLLVEENGKPKRVLDIFPKDMIINLLEALGGADVSGETLLRMGFGIGFPVDTPQGSRWFFVETRQNFCPLCQGEKTVRNEAELELVGETCWVCNGVGSLKTDPVPRQKAEVILHG
jgi:hypothetical protein